MIRSVRRPPPPGAPVRIARRTASWASGRLPRSTSVPREAAPASGRTRSCVPTVYSHSRLASFENCPKQFHYRYVLRIPSPAESIEAFLGKRVHEVLEKLYLFVGEGRIPSVEAVLRRFRLNFEAAYDPARVRIVRAENPVATYLEMGERCLRNFYRRHYPFDAGETLGVEENVTAALDPAGVYRVRGVIDRLVRAPDGAVEIHDYKTGQRVPPQRALDEDRQLALYQLAVAGRFGQRVEVRLVWHYLLSNQRRSSRRTAEQLEALRERTIAQIDAIESTSQFEPRPSALCAWCEYRALCPAAPREAGAPPAAEVQAPSAPRPPRVADPPADPTQQPLFVGGTGAGSI